jgi:uncharacterized protein YbbC (DUF1343 family)
MKLGVEVLLQDAQLLSQLKGKKLSLLAHPASVNKKLQHTLDLLMQMRDLNVVSGFGPQHGIKGDKQYNMDETPHAKDERYQIPIYSLYSDTRRPTAEMLSGVDAVLIDLQDVGCRIYTYVATLVYMLEACSEHNVEVWILDRPNPIGRKVEGSYLQSDWKSFVGEVELPMRHGLTLGELAKWYKNKQNLLVPLHVVPMEDYKPVSAPTWGWSEDLPWVNPSPQIPSLRSCRPYCGTVLLEATDLSEGRGMTNPLEVVASPQFPTESVLRIIEAQYKDWLKGCALRPTYFVPTFNKHKGQLCQGLHIHTDNCLYDYENFQPYRLMAAIFKALKQLAPSEDLWSSFHYEYEKDRLPIDLLTGGNFFRQWVDDAESSVSDFEYIMKVDEEKWAEERRPFLLY